MYKTIVKFTNDLNLFMTLESLSYNTKIEQFHYRNKIESDIDPNVKIISLSKQIQNKKKQTF